MKVAGVIATQVARQTNERMRKEYNIPPFVSDDDMPEWIGKEMARRILKDSVASN